MPYLNSAPFFQGLSVGSAELIDCVPRQLGVLAQAGELSAGLMPLVDFVRLRDQFERIGHFGIAVRGRAHSALLFSRRPLRQLDGCAVAVTEESSTTACLVRLLLEQRFHLKPSGYPRGRDPGAEGLVLIGDEALREKYGQAGYPYETDLAFEWWLWQHRPFVFAVWAVRRDLPAQEKKALELGLIRTLAMNLSRLEQIAQEASKTIGIPEETLHLYLSNFVYRLGPSEDEAIATFEELCRRHALL